MSNARTGMWSALGAILGGVAGAAAAKYVVESRPRGRSGQRDRSSEVEDAMVVGGAAGAVLGSFVAGAATGEGAPAPQLATGR
jgi:outer membrane lipoprotein SlyB